MMNITVICVGKLKEQYLRDACAEYSKRLSSYCKLCIVELTPKALPNNPSDAQIENALMEEGVRISEKIPNNSTVFALCIEGRQISSAELSNELEKLAVDGAGNITFVIGGSFGLSDEIKKKANYKLSMSKMTFPHQLARVMLLEQIYRAFQISSGGKYHK